MKSLKNLCVTLFIAAIIVFAHTSQHTAVVHAKLLTDWSYDELLKQSDVVVIATAECSIDNESTSKLDLGAKVAHKEVITDFDIKLVIKGKVEKSLKLQHYRLEIQPLGGIEDGPSIVTFFVKDELGNYILNDKKDYLLFLKLGKDDKYLFVSGIEEPQHSIRLLDNKYFIKQ
jgi:hypothetical protein